MIMPSASITHLIEGRVPPRTRQGTQTPVKALLEGTVNIHIHNDANDSTVSHVPTDERVPAEASLEVAKGAKNYSFRVKRDAEGRIVEILATRLS